MDLVKLNALIFTEFQEGWFAHYKRPLQLLHMDLIDPTKVKTIGGKK